VNVEVKPAKRKPHFPNKMKSENETEPFTPLQDLDLMGDRRTCALLDKQGNIVWYCPKRLVHAGSEDVDVSAVLFPLWGYAWEKPE
jgi:hypothetical protein